MATLIRLKLGLYLRQIVLSIVYTFPLIARLLVIRSVANSAGGVQFTVKHSFMSRRDEGVGDILLYQQEI